MHKALTIKQPWAHLVIHGVKRVENRSFSVRHRGQLFIHASLATPKAVLIEAAEDYPALPWENLEFGAFVGVVDVVGMVTASTDPFFCGPYGWVLENPRPIPAFYWKGQVGLWNVTDDLAKELLREGRKASE